MQNQLLDYKQDEANIKKFIDKEFDQKTKLIYDKDSYDSQFRILTRDCLQQCEKSSAQKGAKEMIDFKAQVTSHEKVIEAIRAANFVEIQNVNNRFKRLLKEILEQISDQLCNLFKQEFLKLWLEWKSAKTALQEKELKLKSAETTQQIQEQELIQIRTQFSAQNTFLEANKKLEDTITNLESQNTKLKDNVTNLNKQLGELKLSHEELNKNYLKLQQQFDEAKEGYEKEINSLKLKEQNLIKANKDFIDLTNQLAAQADRYKELYEMQNQRNIDLTDQVRYWKSTHQQRLVDLQNSEQRVGSQKGYLFKYRREVQDLKRYKLYSEEAQKELSNARQSVHILNQQTEQLRLNCENIKAQHLQIQLEKTENLNQILLKNASSTKKANTETNVFYESPKKGKFDFSILKKVALPPSSADELSQLVINYSKIAVLPRSKVRSVSAKKTNQTESDCSKNNINYNDFEQLTPFTDKNMQQQQQFTFNQQVPKHPGMKNQRIRRQNTQG